MREADLSLSVQDLQVRYGERVAVRSVSFDMAKETVVLFGPSGCGKTSLLKAILGIRERGFEVAGEVTLGVGASGAEDGAVGMVFQGPLLPGWLRLVDQCRLGARNRALSEQDRKELIDDLLRRFGIESLAEEYPSNMSGGEKQRAALVITLSNRPDVLLLDEPTTFLDGTARLAIWAYLEQELRRFGIPTVIVSHDPDEAILLGDRILVLGSPATVRASLSVEFEHPRTPELLRERAFWSIREQLEESVAD